jgi:hypothetical protein
MRIPATIGVLGISAPQLADNTDSKRGSAVGGSRSYLASHADTILGQGRD